MPVAMDQHRPIWTITPVTGGAPVGLQPVSPDVSDVYVTSKIDTLSVTLIKGHPTNVFTNLLAKHCTFKSEINLVCVVDWIN